MPTRSSKKPPKSKTPAKAQAVQPAATPTPGAAVPPARPTRPRDAAQLAWMVVAEATGMELTPPVKEAVAKAPEREKNPHAVALGKLGGAKGGKARAATLSAAQRRDIAANAATARWKKS